MGAGFSIVNVNPKFTRKVTENVDPTGCGAGWFPSTPCGSSRPGAGPRVRGQSGVRSGRRAVRRRRRVGIAKGAETVIPAGGIVMTILAFAGVHQIDNVPIVNGLIALTKMAEMAVRIRHLTGVFTSKRMMSRAAHRHAAGGHPRRCTATMSIPGPPDMSKPLLRVLAGEAVWPPPVWLMRQAGRYLPEYRAVRANGPGFHRAVHHARSGRPRSRLQPIRRYRFDAAILFSDILILPWALGRAWRSRKARGRCCRRSRDEAASAAGSVAPGGQDCAGHGGGAADPRRSDARGIRRHRADRLRRRTVHRRLLYDRGRAAPAISPRPAAGLSQSIVV